MSFIFITKRFDVKKLLFSVITLFFWISGIGQVYESFEYQAIVRNYTGEIVKDQAVSVRFSILKGSTSGSVVYSEKQIVETDQSGLISLAIGGGTEKTGNFTTIEWGTDSYFLKVEIDPSGGTNYTELTTTQLVSVPYSVKAKKKSASAY